MGSLLDILQFFHLLGTEPNIPVSVFIPMIAVIGCLAGLCFYFFVRYHNAKADNSYLRNVKRHHPEAGSLLKTYCVNGDLFGMYADGKGDSYELIIQNKCAGCALPSQMDRSFYPASVVTPKQPPTSEHPLRRAKDAPPPAYKTTDSDGDNMMQMQSSLSLQQSMALALSTSHTGVTQDVCASVSDSSDNYSASDTSSSCTSD